LHTPVCFSGDKDKAERIPQFKDSKIKFKEELRNARCTLWSWKDK
jgi:hypothetical protein